MSLFYSTPYTLAQSQRQSPRDGPEGRLPQIHPALLFLPPGAPHPDPIGLLPSLLPPLLTRPHLSEAIRAPPLQIPVLLPTRFPSSTPRFLPVPFVLTTQCTIQVTPLSPPYFRLDCWLHEDSNHCALFADVSLVPRMLPGTQYNFKKDTAE